MKKLGNIEAELKKSVAYKKSVHRIKQKKIFCIYGCLGISHEIKESRKKRSEITDLNYCFGTHFYHLLHIDKHVLTNPYVGLAI